MTSLRHHLTRHRLAFAWLVAVAMLVRLVVPTGYMPVMARGALTIELCSGFGPEKAMAAMPAKADHHRSQDHHGKGDSPCGFGGHSPPAWSAAAAVLLAFAIIFAMIQGFLAAPALPATRLVRLRPPAIGPPSAA